MLLLPKEETELHHIIIFNENTNRPNSNIQLVNDLATVFALATKDFLSHGMLRKFPLLLEVQELTKINLEALEINRRGPRGQTVYTFLSKNCPCTDEPFIDQPIHS